MRADSAYLLGIRYMELKVEVELEGWCQMASDGIRYMELKA